VNSLDGLVEQHCPVAACCSMLQYVAESALLQYVAWSVLQFVTVRCRVMQGVVESVLQCVVERVSECV